MEFRELTQQERSDVITDISKIMSEKYNISNKSITNFWNTLILGAQYQSQCSMQKTTVDVMYR